MLCNYERILKSTQSFGVNAKNKAIVAPREPWLKGGQTTTILITTAMDEESESETISPTETSTSSFEDFIVLPGNHYKISKMILIGRQNSLLKVIQAFNECK